MTAKSKIKEVDVARPVVHWLSEQGWDVYQEVGAGSIADIVGVRKLWPSGARIVWVVEVKTSLSESVVAQAYRWQLYANYSSVAVPTGKKARNGGLAKRYLRPLGIGMIHVSDSKYHPVMEELAPKLNRKALRSFILDRLREEHKTWAEAGSVGGDRFTPFKHTCSEVLKYVKANPGCTMKEMVGNVKHHYATSASFKSAIPTWVMDGKVPGVVVEKSSNKFRFYPEDSGPLDNQ